ncbi:MAG: 23S rRNA (guanosine(2251)-2'-O)-methyltransferase RlmB [Acholeplasmataceae bacterium]
MIIYGKNVIREAIYAKRSIARLYLDQAFSDRQMLLFLKKNGIAHESVTKGYLNELTDRATHQGIVAEVEPYAYVELDQVLTKEDGQRFIILDGVEDPHNLGAIMRTAEATKLDAIIVGKRRSAPLSATVAKVSSGAIEHVPVALVTNINRAIENLKDAGVLVVGTDDRATVDYRRIDRTRSLAIVLGNEGEGIRPLVKRNCDLLVRIPMRGKINSLNVSVAAALMMYAVLKD